MKNYWCKLKNIFTIIVIFFCLHCENIKAQTLVWEKDIGERFSDFNSILINNDNSFVISGYQVICDSAGNCSYPSKIIKFNNQGDKTWQINENYNTRLFNYGDKIISIDSIGTSIIILDYSGNKVQSILLNEMVTAGYGVSFICQDQSCGEYYIIGFGDDYNTIWKTFIYDSNFNFIRSFPIFDVQMSWVYNCFIKNGFLYTSREHYGKGNFTNIISDVYKYDSLGNLVWTKELLDRYGHAYLSQGDDGIYFGSTIVSGDSAERFWGWELNKYDFEGNTDWNKDLLAKKEGYGVYVWRWVRGVLKTPDGSCLIYGSYNPNQYKDNPLALGYSASGDSLFRIEPTESKANRATSEFTLAAWDNYNYLILAGSIDGVSKIWKYSIPGITAVKRESSGTPNKFSLSQNYPNPFNPTTTISYQLLAVSHVSIKVYDILGHEVTELVNEEKPAGNYSVNFNASKLASGVYIYRMQAGGFVDMKKLILLK